MVENGLAALERRACVSGDAGIRCASSAVLSSRRRDRGHPWRVGAMLSERDAEVRAALDDWGSVDQMGDITRAAFKSHAVAVVVLRISRNRMAKARGRSRCSSHCAHCRSSSRGISCQCTSTRQRRARGSFTPPTCVKARSCIGKARAAAKLRRVRGLAVLISRVGRPAKGKIVLLPDGDA